MKQIIFMGCCAVLFVVPLVFVSHRVYQDGVFGRIGLCGISFSAATFLLEWLWNDVEYELMGQTVALALSFTVFLVWHLFRFHCRVVRSGKMAAANDADCGRQAPTTDGARR